MRSAYEFFQKLLRTEWIRLLGREAVAAVDLREEVFHAKRFDDRARRVDGLVGEHGHGARMSISSLANARERLGNSRIGVSVVELVLAVVSQKIFERAPDRAFVFGIAERAADQHRRTVTNVRGDDVAGQFGASEVAEHGVYGMDEIEPRVDQCAIEVEDEELDGGGIERAESTDH